ncbi:acyltransferase [Kibdelosporangium persicum]|uniref:Peptidoglycan/LPS O-acetylase OafA/YrhL n=1 Tax=Kibdelosporangium persicum TaxID=2698649 RepID=A0ABX2F5A6_9PSEU|nr:acyltransferase [Kibdelosporangium persicum]NRN66549.1 peptidoglycan/LPS O-acetylase OafA/YrhL [Kibdelosporangium persicum]
MLTTPHQEQPAPARVLPSLTGLRAIAAFLVFGLHFMALRLSTPVGSAQPEGSDAVIGMIFGSGGAGVVAFFILSGFVLTWSTPADQPAGRFWWRRFAKIYPACLVSILAGFVLFGLLIGAWPDWKVLVAQVLLIQAWLPDQAYTLNINPVTWSLSVEVFFYLVFPALMLMLARASKRALWWTAAGSVVATFVLPYLISANFDFRQPEPPLLVPLVGFPNGFSYWFTTSFPLMRLFEFVLGITIALLVRKGVRFPVNVPVALSLSVAALAVSPMLPGMLGSTAIVMIPFGLLIAALANADLAGAWSPLRSAVMVFLGKISYCFYLVHIFFIVFSMSYVPGPTGAMDLPREWLAGIGVIDSPVVGLPAWANVAVFLLYLGLSVLAAWVLYTVVEVPATRALRNVRRRRDERPTPTPEPEPELAVRPVG